MNRMEENETNHPDAAPAREEGFAGATGATGPGETDWHDDCFSLDALRVGGASRNHEPDAGEGVHHHNEGRDMEKYCAGNGVNDGSVEPAERLTDGEIEEGVAANEGLVRSIVGRTMQQRGPELDEDMLQMGRIALWTALRHFNPRRGMKLSTYAGACIRNCILDELKRRKRYQGFFVRSLQEPLGDDEEGTLGDIVPDENAATPDEVLGKRELRESVLRGVAELPARDREVVEMRYGLRDGTCRSQREIAVAQDVSDQRIHVIHKRAIERLRGTDPAA